MSSANILVVFVDISTANLPDDIQSAILLKFMIDDEYEVFVTGFQPSCTYCVYTVQYILYSSSQCNCVLIFNYST